MTGTMIIDGSAKQARWTHHGLGSIAAILSLGVIMAWTSASFPAELPAWAPYEFSWVAYLGIALPSLWYVRGLWTMPALERPGVAKVLTFGLGMILLYAMLLSRFVYLSQHMFFLNRLQHLGMHHIGPFFLALSWPGSAIRKGMPDWVARLLRGCWLQIPLRMTRNPLIAGVLFAGLVALWLQPDIHFHAMLSPTLYDVMNWTMVGDGLLFWFLVLDPRPNGNAAISYAKRLVLTLAVEFPQILIGAHLTFSTAVIYTYYDLCGRLFPDISAITDQHIGGVVIWMPQGMMGAIAFLLILNNMRRNEDSTGLQGEPDILVRGLRISSSRWTGR